MNILEVHHAIAKLLNHSRATEHMWMNKINKASINHRRKDLPDLWENWKYCEGRTGALEDVLVILADCDELVKLIEAEANAEEEEK